MSQKTISKADRIWTVAVLLVIIALTAYMISNPPRLRSDEPAAPLPVAVEEVHAVEFQLIQLPMREALPIATSTPVADDGTPYSEIPGYMDTDPIIYEDDPRWDCRTMGNETCGVEIMGEVYLITFTDGQPVIVTPRGW